MKRSRSGHSRSPSPELDDDHSRGLPIRVPVTPTKAGVKEFASPFRPRQTLGGGASAAAAAAAAAPKMLPPPSPLKTGQVRPEQMRAPFSRLQQESGGGSHHQPALAPTFQSPSKHRPSLAHASRTALAGAGAALAVSSPPPPPKVVTAGGAMRVLTPAKAARSRASLGGTKRPRLSGADALGREGDGALSTSTPSSSSSASSASGSGSGTDTGNVAGGGVKKDAGTRRSSWRSNSFGAAQRVSTHSTGSGRGQENDDDDDDDNDTDNALLAAELNAGSNSSRDRPLSSASESAAATDRLVSSSSSSSFSLRVGTAMKRASGDGGGAGDGTRVQQRWASAAARRSSNAKDMRSGSSSEPTGGSSGGPPAYVLDLGKAPRRVSTWSNNSGSSSSSGEGGGGARARARNRNSSTGGSSSSSSSTASDLDTTDAAATTGKRGPSLISASSSAASAKNNPTVAGAGRVRNRSTSSGGGGSGGAALSRRVSSGRLLVGACQLCGARGGEEGEGEGREELVCDACGGDFGAEGAGGLRGAGARAKGRRSGVSAASLRRRSALRLSTADAAASGGGGVGGGGDGLDNQDPNRRMSIQDFQVTSSLGQGKFGNVYKAKSRQSNKTVAIKMINKSKVRAGIEQDAVNMHRERLLQSHLRHPNIVSLQNCFQDPKFIYLVLDYVAGGDVHRLLSQEKNRKGLPLATAAGYLRDALAAVSHLHGIDIMHRDIKAENLLLDGKGRLKLSDFGWATLAKPPLHKRKTLCGTPEYAPPEMLVRLPKYTKAVDVWSLGVLAFELLTGQTPFAKPHATSPKPTDGTPAGGTASPSPDGGFPTATAASGADASLAAEVEAVHGRDNYAKLYGRIAGWGGSRESLFGPGTLGAGVPDRAVDVVMSMLRPRPRDRLESGAVLRLPWLASRGKEADVAPA